MVYLYVNYSLTLLILKGVTATAGTLFEKMVDPFRLGKRLYFGQKEIKIGVENSYLMKDAADLLLLEKAFPYATLDIKSD